MTGLVVDTTPNTTLSSQRALDFFESRYRSLDSLVALDDVVAQVELENNQLGAQVRVFEQYPSQCRIVDTCVGDGSSANPPQNLIRISNARFLRRMNYYRQLETCQLHGIRWRTT